MKTITIYSKKLANQLIEKGFKLIRTEVNFDFPKYKVFIFEYDDEIDNILKSLKRYTD